MEPHIIEDILAIGLGIIFARLIWPLFFNKNPSLKYTGEINICEPNDPKPTWCNCDSHCDFKVCLHYPKDCEHDIRC